MILALRRTRDGRSCVRAPTLVPVPLCDEREVCLNYLRTLDSCVKHCEGTGFKFAERSDPSDVLPVLCRLLKEHTSSPAINVARLPLRREGQLLDLWCPNSPPLTWVLMMLGLAWG